MAAHFPASDATIADRLLAVEEYLATCPLHYTELIKGRVIECGPFGARHGRVVLEIASPLQEYVKETNSGQAFLRCGYIVSRAPDSVCGPDISYLEESVARISAPAMWRESAPTLAVEVNSPDDNPEQIEEKVQLYLAAGTKIVWVVDADSRTVSVRTPDGEPMVLREGAALEGGEVVPGFVLPLSEIFEP